MGGKTARGDIRAKIGPTAEELQNGLCLTATIPEKTSDFLRTTVEACLKEIIKTVSGQFITHNTENDQYYLDLQKTIDHDAKIQDKSETLSDSQLDQYYFDALTRVLELTDLPPYVRGYQIWEHEIEWREHKITRRGYLFFGAPNERSTAQPPRDFYLYFLQPFESPQFDDQKLADEVFFRLAHRDKQFQDALRSYAGAREMAASVSAGTKKVYEDKADGFLKTLVAWLRTNMLTAFEVIHQGVPKKMVEWLSLKSHRTGNAAVRDLLELTGSVCLAAFFEDRYPEYPTFTVNLHASNLKQPTEDALRWLTGGVKNNLSTAVLDGLELLDGDKLKPHQSRYARVVLEKLDGKTPGQVVNRKELIAFKNDVERECRQHGGQGPGPGRERRHIPGGGQRHPQDRTTRLDRADPRPGGRHEGGPGAGDHSPCRCPLHLRRQAVPADRQYDESDAAGRVQSRWYALFSAKTAWGSRDSRGVGLPMPKTVAKWSASSGRSSDSQKGRNGGFGLGGQKAARGRKQGGEHHQRYNGRMMGQPECQ